MTAPALLLAPILAPILILALALVLALAPLHLSAAETITLPQHGGGELVLQQPAQRIITLAPHLVELVYLAGAEAQLLATVAYSNYPAAAETLPRIGDAFRFDLERILSLRPDLVIAWDSGNPEAALTGLEALGLAVWRTEIRSIDDMAVLLRQLGSATGRDTRAAAAAVESRWQALQARYADRAAVSYFYQVAERPLYTINGAHLISQALGACGARNVFEGLPTLAPQVNPEAVLQANPEVLFAGRIDAGATSLDHWRSWPRLHAVRDEALFYLPADLINRATPRLLDAVEIACRLLEDYRSGRPANGAGS